MLQFYQRPNSGYKILNQPVFVVFGILHCIFLLLKLATVSNKKWVTESYIGKNLIKNPYQLRKCILKEEPLKSREEETQETFKEEKETPKEETKSEEEKLVRFQGLSITEQEIFIYKTQVYFIIITFLLSIIFLFTNVFYGLAIMTFLIICSECLPFISSIEFHGIFQKCFSLLDIMIFMVFLNFLLYSFSSNIFTMVIISMFVFIYIFRILVVKGKRINPYDGMIILAVLVFYFIQFFVFHKNIKFFSVIY